MLWFESNGEVDKKTFEALWVGAFGAPPQPGGESAVVANEKLMKRRGPYETPAAWIAGRWFFAQDRSEQVADWLDELGWRAK
uniref:Unannotated protein n=1 Tax=freshwater metagenome TaxID=449393 RepID=A0A6J5ZKQ0_9ZZZZ